ncbi:hypothetical protein [Flavihumibacter fluvii]|uniref:hypothetical protein n=1 Tax=Flavihumibacter fluvii TaxID=2838157 RepID=UPI001BDDD922|nr:hypothetical protein [Flavihumibacter fluvii]ULQ51705.1 hypothetical protein KJS93_16575 [Flavihumibacter fluvii]
MIKVYFDWNVMAQMKDGLHDELREIAFNDDNFFIPYSTSHISDIFSSFKENDVQAELINRDLEFISKLTKDTFLFNTGKEVIIDFAPPIEYFNQLVDQRDVFKDISIDGLFKHFEDDEVTKYFVKPYLNLLKAIPLDDVFKEAFENPQSAGQMEKMFPGLKENPTMEGFFQSFSEMLKGLNEDGKYKDLRKIVQTGLGINRDKIFDNKYPFNLIQSQYKQLGQFQVQHINNNKNAPKWFNEISNEYILLDMHGYQEDNVNVLKGRKETFKNTTEDAFHAAFASTCNFYVINDKKSYKKTKQVYEKLQINTVVLKPDEFVKYYNDYLHFTDPSLNISIPFQLLQNGEFHEEHLESGAVLRTYYFPFYIFGFFTKLMLLLSENEEPPILLLSRLKPTNGTTYIMEISKLAKDISKLLGSDIDGFGDVKEKEFAEEIWIGRNWKMGNIIFRLANPNGHFQLYIDQEESHQAT